MRARSGSTRRPRRLVALIVGSTVAVVLVPSAATASAAATSSARPSASSCRTAPKPVTAPHGDPFGPNVTVFDPSMPVSAINAALNAAPPAGGSRQFYFLPGTYGDASATPSTATTSTVIQAEVASGTAVAGLGSSPCDVVINGALSINNGFLAIRPSQLSNLTINPIQKDVPAHSMLWYTSQTATWRRVNLLGNLYVSPVVQTPGACQNPCDPATQGFQINVIPGVANGFMISNSSISGNVINGDGQNRPGVEGNGSNSDIYFQQDAIGGTYSGFGSDMVFAGTVGAPADDFAPGTVAPIKPAGDVVTLPTVATVREQPWVYYDRHAFRVFSPSVQHDVRGPNWTTSAREGTALPLSDFYLARSAVDTATTLNAALSRGKDLLVGPGLYVLDKPLVIGRPHAVVLGLGDPTLRSDNTSTIVVRNSATGTVIAKLDANGRAFDAADTGQVPFAENQIVIGDTPRSSGRATDPTTLTDVNTGSGSRNLYLLNQNYVILDQGEVQSNNNSGDGYTTANWTAASSETGAIVNGDHVTWHGIWLEHFKKTEITWNGNFGNVTFLQNERPLTVPYDLPAERGVQPHVWKMNSHFDGYPALAVSGRVRRFTMNGFQSWSRLGNGCYCNVTSVITSPVRRGVRMHGLFTGEILGSTPPGTTPTGATVGGAFNLVNHDGASASVPFSVGPWGATSAWPYSDLAGHGATARVTDFPTRAQLAGAR